MMTRLQVLDLYYLDARAKLIELAGFLDRVERAEGEADFRLEALRQALPILWDERSGKAARVLRSLSDPTSLPIPVALGKSACGAYPG